MTTISNSSVTHAPELRAAGTIRPSEIQSQQFHALLIGMQAGLGSGQSQTNKNQTPSALSNWMEETTSRIGKAEDSLKALQAEIREASQDMNITNTNNAKLSEAIVRQKLVASSYFVYISRLESGASNMTEEMESITKRHQ